MQDEEMRRVESVLRGRFKRGSMEESGWCGVPQGLCSSLSAQDESSWCLSGEAPLWAKKPALRALLQSLETLRRSGDVLPRKHENFSPPGVQETLPPELPLYKLSVLQAYQALLSALQVNNTPSPSSMQANTCSNLYEAHHHPLQRETNTCSNLYEAHQHPLQRDSSEEKFHETNEDIASRAADHLIQVLGKAGVLYFLGHRCTVGSIDALCPAIETLVESFCKPIKPNAKLSAGGRAFTKHCHRSTDGFWPAFGGSDEKKNQIAFEKLEEILCDAAWVNVHLVPKGDKVSQLPIVEIRHPSGYGARWTADGSFFRGFLEPVAPYFEDTSSSPLT